jgi:DNA-directed RNA polymerase subunit RPC12/RpoP
MQPWNDRSARSPHDPLGVGIPDLLGVEVVRDRELLAEPEVVGGAVNLEVPGSKGVRARLSFAGATPLTLATSGSRQRYALARYAEVLEVGRTIDVLGRRRTPQAFQPLAFWCSACYDGPRRHGRIKPDCEFVLILASAAKDERIVARRLQPLGHHLRGEAVEERSPYLVVISARRGGRDAKADLECTRCGVRFEVKGRPNDSKLRFSHSPKRTFAQENRRQDFQVIVERHRTIRVFRNADIIDDEKHAIPGEDKMDSWIEYPSHWGESHECGLPPCAATLARAAAAPVLEARS